MPWEAVWVDTETHEETTGPGEVKHLLTFGWACYRRRTKDMTWSAPDWHRFETVEQFWTWVFSLLHGKSRLYIFAHNGAFDYPVLDTFNLLPAWGWTLTKAVIDSPPVILNWRQDGHSILMLDTLNIWRMPLSKLGKQMGLPKLTMPPKSASRARWDAYCRRDVKVIMRACLRWWAFLWSNDLGGFAPTLAAQAFRTYRHKFMHHRILIDDNEKALALARESYLGGRVECFRIGRVEGPLYLLDVNSMYPFVMRQTPMPTRLIAHTYHATVDDILTWLVDRCVVAEVTIRTERPMFPLVVDGRLCFPVGMFKACLASPELERAAIAGEIVSVHRAAVYERAPLFRDFVDYFWKMRQEAQSRGDDVTDSLAKILQNSLYGKMGQRGRVFEVVGHTEEVNPRLWQEYDADTGTVRKLRAFAGVIQEYRDEGEARESHPAIAAHVTSAARLYLWQLIVRAGREHVFYTDTDGLWVDQVGLDRLASHIDGKTLGKLKVEQTQPWMIFHGAKDYESATYSKTKGVSKTPYWRDGANVVQDQWSSLVGLLRVGDLTAPRTRMVAKQQQRIYTKGIVQADGVVLPLVLP
jgi:hypothetical protein